MGFLYRDFALSGFELLDYVNSEKHHLASSSLDGGWHRLELVETGYGVRPLALRRTEPRLGSLLDMVLRGLLERVPTESGL